MESPSCQVTIDEMHELHLREKNDPHMLLGPRKCGRYQNLSCIFIVALRDWNNYNRWTSGNKGGQSLMVYMMNIAVIEPTHNICIHQPVTIRSRSEYFHKPYTHHLFRKVASSSTYSHEGMIQVIDTWPSLLVCPFLSNPFQLCGSTTETTIKPPRWIDAFEQSRWWGLCWEKSGGLEKTNKQSEHLINPGPMLVSSYTDSCENTCAKHTDKFYGIDQWLQWSSTLPHCPYPLLLQLHVCLLVERFSTDLLAKPQDGCSPTTRWPQHVTTSFINKQSYNVSAISNKTLYANATVVKAKLDLLSVSVPWLLKHQTRVSKGNLL